MAFCTKCGKQLNDGVKFCPGCGANQSAADNSAPEQPQYQQTQDQQQYQAQPVYQPPMDSDARDIQENKPMAILAYIGILVLIPIFAAPNSKFARFHSNQGLWIAIAGVALSVLQVMVNLAFPWYSPLFALRYALTGILALAGLGLLAYMILGIINAAQGQYKYLPLMDKILAKATLLK